MEVNKITEEEYIIYSLRTGGRMDLGEIITFEGGGWLRTRYWGVTVEGIWTLSLKTWIFHINSCDKKA